MNYDQDTNGDLSKAELQPKNGQKRESGESMSMYKNMLKKKQGPGNTRKVRSGDMDQRENDVEGNGFEYLSDEEQVSPQSKHQTADNRPNPSEVNFWSYSKDKKTQIQRQNYCAVKQNHALRGITLV